MSIPTFQLTHKVPVNIRRRGGEGDYVGGVWVPATYTVVVVEANVQPLQFKELMLLTESERTKEWIKLYSAEQLRTGNEGVDGWEADVVEWEGNLYRVMKSRHYVMGILDHYHVMAAREPRSAQG